MKKNQKSYLGILLINSRDFKYVSRFRNKITMYGINSPFGEDKIAPLFTEEKFKNTYFL